MSSFLTQTQFFIGLLLLLSSCASNKSKNDDVTPTDQLQWKRVVSSDESQPIARHEAAFVGLKDKMYLLGGRRVRPVSIFNTKTQVWTEGAKPPLELHHFQAVVFEDEIYLLGAMTGGYPTETPVPYIYIYNPDKDSWRLGDEIPSDRLRGSAGVVVYQNKIYVAAGIQNGHVDGHVPWFDVYDPKTGLWSKLEDAPRPRDHFQMAVADDKLYLVGGRLSKAPNETWKHTIAAVDVYDFKKEKWSSIASLPTERAGNMVTNFNGNILVVGGETEWNDKAHNEAELFNPETMEWTSLPELLEGRHGTGLVNYRNEIYVASGSGEKGGRPELVTMEKLTVVTP